MMPRITLPPGPIRSRILSTGICSVRICGACFDFSVRCSAQVRVHRVQQEEPAAARLLQRLAHDLRGDAADLDVHLQRGDAGPGSRNLEIHIAVVIFRSGNIGQDRVLSPSFTRPIATPATDALIGMPASISARLAPQTEAIDEEPFDSRMSETMRIA